MTSFNTSTHISDLEKNPVTNTHLQFLVENNAIRTLSPWEIEYNNKVFDCTTCLDKENLIDDNACLKCACQQINQTTDLTKSEPMPTNPRIRTDPQVDAYLCENRSYNGNSLINTTINYCQQDIADSLNILGITIQDQTCQIGDTQIGKSTTSIIWDNIKNNGIVIMLIIILLIFVVIFAFL